MSARVNASWAGVPGCHSDNRPSPCQCAPCGPGAGPVLPAVRDGPPLPNEPAESPERWSRDFENASGFQAAAGNRVQMGPEFFRARLPPERMPGICPALCCRVRRIGTIDEEDWCQRRLARSCSSPRVGLRPSAHSRFRGFRARARSMAISYAPSRRLAPAIRSASQPDTLRFAWSARTRSHGAVSSGSVTVTVFMSLEQDGTNFVSSRSRVTKAAPLGPPGPGAEDRCEEGRRARPRDSSPGVGVD